MYLQCTGTVYTHVCVHVCIHSSILLPYMQCSKLRTQTLTGTDLCEFVGLDLEMAFMEHCHEVLLGVTLSRKLIKIMPVSHFY